MRRRWVVDASPLILLGKIDHLELLRELTDELLIPDGVAHEVQVKRGGGSSIRSLIDPPSVRIEDSGPIPREVDVWDLGRGESEVLALSLATEGSRAVVDDKEARRCAQTLGVPVVGTLGVILRAKRIGRIPAARPLLNRLREVGLYVSDELVERALSHLKE